MSEELETPQSRTEEILQNALGGSYDVEPQSRVETLLTKVIESGGGGSAFVVNVEVEFNELGFVVNTIDKTFNEIKSAIESGSIVFADVDIIGNQKCRLYYTQLIEIEDTNNIYFDNISCSNSYDMKLIDMQSISLMIPETGDAAFTLGIHSFQLSGD